MPDAPTQPSRRAMAHVAVDGVVRSVAVEPCALDAHQVRVAVSCASLGSFGWPAGPGVERLGDTFTGRIVEVGTNIDQNRLGQAVLGIRRAGSAASELVVSASTVFPRDESLPEEIVTAAATSAMVAWSLANLVDPARGTVVVVNAAGSGITTVLAGLLRRAGATAIAVRDFDSGAEDLINAGFEAVVTPSARSAGNTIRAMTAGTGAGVVIDCARPLASWVHIESMLAAHGRAITWTPGPDWDPNRSLTINLIDQLSHHLVSRGDFAPMSRLVHQLTCEIMAHQLSLPVQVFDERYVQAAYDTGSQPAIIGRVALRLNSDGPIAPGPMTGHAPVG